ncbi:MAG TPA: ketopantoate reductase family protein, partial [Actinomycetota bacterium]|nr:ketopantoate reductase family protein [Actinomycetota bacterium]
MGVPRIAVFGTGGVGGYFGGRLAQAGADVQLVARGRHLEQLRKHGLRVRSVRGDFELPVPATDDPAEIGPCDYVLFAVKSYDTSSAARRLGPLVGEGTAVVSLQNGLGNEERIAEHVGRDHVMGGVAYIWAHIAEPGVIEDIGGTGKVAFGELDGTRSMRAERLLELFTEAGVTAELPADVRSAIWHKYTFILALSGMTAVVRRPLGDIRDTPETWAMFEQLLTEGLALAEAEAVALPSDTMEVHRRFAHGLEPHGYSSLHHDLVNGRRMELEALHGEAV